MSPVVVVGPTTESNKPVATAPTRQRTCRVSAARLETFTRNLQTQLEAGVPIVRALHVETEQSDTPALATVCQRLLDQINSGATFSDAVERQVGTFGHIYRNLVRAGEHSGRLPQMLAELADFLSWREEVRKTVRKATIYPTIVLVATFGLVLFVLGFVFPKFADLFARLGDEVPFLATVLMSAGRAVEHHWLLIMAGFGGVGCGLWLLSRTHLGRSTLLQLASRSPLVGSVMREIDLARTSRTLAILSAAGIPLVRALELSRDVVGDSRMRAALTEMGGEVVSGQTFAQAAAHAGVFPAMALNLFAVGEESGQMSSVLERLAAHFDRRARDAVQRMLTIMEPAITLFLGLFVGALAVTIITTLYKAMMAMGK